MEPAAVSRLATQLDGVGTTLYGHRGDLDASPDAGRSSNEVAAALAGLAGALAGIAQDIGSLPGGDALTFWD